MRPTFKISVCLAAIGLGLLVFCNSGRPEEAAQAKPGIKELEQKRLVVLKKLYDSAKNLFQNARIEYTDVNTAQRELFAARLEYAETRQDRIKACDEAIEEAGQCRAIAEARKASARGTEFAVLHAQDFELQAQIVRAKIEAGK